MMKAWQHFKTITTHKMMGHAVLLQNRTVLAGTDPRPLEIFADGISGRHEILPGRPSPNTPSAKTPACQNPGCTIKAQQTSF